MGNLLASDLVSGSFCMLAIRPSVDVRSFPLSFVELVRIVRLYLFSSLVHVCPCNQETNPLIVFALVQYSFFLSLSTNTYTCGCLSAMENNKRNASIRVSVELHRRFYFSLRKRGKICLSEAC